MEKKKYPNRANSGRARWKNVPEEEKLLKLSEMGKLGGKALWDKIRALEVTRVTRLDTGKT